MAIAYDAVSSTSTSAFGNRSFTHTPVGTPKGVVVFVIENEGIAVKDPTFPDQVSSVTYGGVSMTEAASSPNLAASATAEDCAMHCFVLTSGIPSGAQTVSVTSSASTGITDICCVTVTSAGNTSVVNTLTYDGVGANPASTLTLSGNTCLVMEGVFSGQAAVTGITPPTGWSSTREYDTGSEQHAVYVYDTVGSSDVSTGFTQTSDDYKVFAIALKEVLSGSFAPPRRGLREFSPMLVR
jgi:hypothetical protein